MLTHFCLIYKEEKKPKKNKTKNYKVFTTWFHDVSIIFKPYKIPISFMNYNGVLGGPHFQDLKREILVKTPLSPSTVIKYQHFLCMLESVCIEYNVPLIFFNKTTELYHIFKVTGHVWSLFKDQWIPTYA